MKHKKQSRRDEIRSEYTFDYSTVLPKRMVKQMGIL